MPFDMSLFENPAFIGGMSLLGTPGPQGMQGAIQAIGQMQQLKQKKEYEAQMLDLQNRTQSAHETTSKGHLGVEQGTLAETERHNAGWLTNENARTDLLRQQLLMQQQQQAAIHSYLRSRGVQLPPELQPQPGQQPLVQPQQSGAPLVQPQPGDTNARQLPIPTASGPTGATGQAPDPSQFFRTRIIPAEGGMNADGTFRTSVKGAIGPAQVMPETAPEAARLAGVPFDEKRYRTDPAYNTMLGDAYFNKQYKDFGNLPMAAAAYNGGPERLAQAQKLATQLGNPAAWLSFMPKETQAYVQKTTGGYSGGMVPPNMQGQPGQQGPAPGTVPPLQGDPFAGSRQGQVDAGTLRLLGGDMGGMTNLAESEAPHEIKGGETYSTPKGMFEAPLNATQRYEQWAKGEENKRATAAAAREAELQPGKVEAQNLGNQKTKQELPEIAARTEKEQATATQTQQTTDKATLDRYNAFKQYESLNSELLNLYQQLKDRGAIVDTDKGPLENLIAARKSSAMGQKAATMGLSTKAALEDQSIRNQINAIKPLMMAAMKQAYGMGARQMDSDKEMAFYNAANTDPTKDVQSNFAALHRLNKILGPGSPGYSAFMNTDAVKQFEKTQGSRGNDITSKPEKGTSGNPMTPEEYADSIRKRRGG